MPLDLAVASRAGEGAPVLFLPGFGSTEEDYTDVALHPALDDRPVIAYDAPGCGQTTCGDLSAVSIPFLVATASAVLATPGVDRFHLVGHSMGGLTALLLADRDPARGVGFVDIEGNVAPEDCFLSRQIISHPHSDPQGFLTEFADRVWSSGEYSSALYAAGLPHKVRAEAVRPIFASMVDLSDHGQLMQRFLRLPFPRVFVYGEQNRSLSYLPTLADHGVELAEIPHSGHWPMYSNPPAMWSRITEFVTRTSADDTDRNRVS
ncbi:alpha/beta fold hydrolase [Geodermatophilus sp. TF02-6]|uniref:alpha/beta fold hydrolase n=1 Tax=Geodermatophilus sp. TF02-6 TaxID=2250575 RepID=UPI0018F3DE44|nr:alpha/beta hydrolase [Geodermatophilus sp. TF02-6]